MGQFDPPFTYDDPRLTYDERCFFYDSPYDQVCLQLAPRRRIGGGRSTSIKTKNPYVNIRVCGKLCVVNGNVYICDNEKEGNQNVISIVGELEPPCIEISSINVVNVRKKIEAGLEIDKIDSESSIKPLKFSINPITSSMKIIGNIITSSLKSNISIKPHSNILNEKNKSSSTIIKGELIEPKKDKNNK